jgi:hypothetical protein
MWDPRVIVQLEVLGQLKNQVILSGIETAIFRLVHVVECLNQLRYRMPQYCTDYDKIGGYGFRNSYDQMVIKEDTLFFIWFVRLLALRPLLAYCASLG